MARRVRMMAYPDLLPTELSVPRKIPRFGLPASAALHVAALAMLVFAVPRPLPVQPPQAISVEIVPIDAVAANAAPQLPAAGAADPDRPVQSASAGSGPGAANAPEPDVPATHTATSFYASGVLTEPGMAKIRRALAGFADSERVVQLCNIEGIEQIRRAAPQYDPDTIVSYAMSDPVAQGLSLIAAGAAFRSRRHWYRLSFTCTAAAALDGVTAYAFQLGDAIPEAEWEAHNLNAEDKGE